jgi:hypothetical protein
VVARSFVHDGRPPVIIPNWRIFIVQIDSPFRLVRECSESRTPSKTEGNYLPPLDTLLLIPTCAERHLSELPRPLPVRRERVSDFWGKFQLKVEELVAHMPRGLLPALDALNWSSLHQKCAISLFGSFTRNARYHCSVLRSADVIRVAASHLNTIRPSFDHREPACVIVLPTHTVLKAAIMY